MKETPAPHRLLLSSYPLCVNLETRYMDIDSYAHLNNGAIGRFYENSRAHMHMQVFQSNTFHRADSREKTLLVETRLRYFAEGFYPGQVSIGSGIGEIGNSSYQIHQALFQNDQCLGLCEATMVYVVDGVPSAISGELRQRYRDLLIGP